MAERFARRANGLVRFLSVLDLVLVDPRSLRQVLLAIELADRAACGRNGRLRQRRAVGTHVRDETVFVEALRGAHGARRREAQLATRLLLQGRGHERRCRAAPIGLTLDRRNACFAGLQGLGQALRLGLAEQQEVLLQPAGIVEVLAGGEALAAKRRQGRGKLLRVPSGASKSASMSQ